MRNKVLKNISIVLSLTLGLAFVARFAGAAILRLYLELGIGGCSKNIILCSVPGEEVINHTIDQSYLEGLTQYKFPGIEISLPKTFLVMKEVIKKAYYKKMKHRQGRDLAYLLYERPGFLMDLFPRAKKTGTQDDYEFLQHIMYSRPQDIKGLDDAFFVVMKSIFIPDLGGKKNIKIIKFSDKNKKGFIAYSLDAQANYFDCNIVDSAGNFFKVYIKDKDVLLDLDKVLTILSTLKHN